MLEHFGLRDDQAGCLAHGADEVALVVAERRHVTLAAVAQVSRPVTARAELGIIAGGLVEPFALALVVIAHRLIVPVGASHAWVDHAEVPGSDQSAAGLVVVRPPRAARAAIGGAIEPMEALLAVVPRPVHGDHAHVDLLAGERASPFAPLLPAFVVRDAHSSPLAGAQVRSFVL